ncbi:MAG TPA: riboflavin biosynthesis protein RibF, partial [Chitinophagaceae bacterium]|nr:riboflavin biosynthesis protein RibF [Chitinophagaceae bacterium]
GESVIITFDPHPRKVVRGAALELINNLEEKIALLNAQEIDHLVVVPFTPAFSEQPAESYIEDFLIRNFHPHTIIIGYDHHFGKDRSGNFELLARRADRYGYTLIEIPRHVLDEIGISSTAIRQALRASEVERANKLLGYPYFFSGTVVRGDQLGRQLGYPTANLIYSGEDKIRLGHGVYAVYAETGGERYKGMLSIGTRPTLDDRQEKVEVFLFDFSREIYGASVNVEVHHYLRSQERYDSLEALMAQMKKDEEATLRLLS